MKLATTFGLGAFVFVVTLAAARNGLGPSGVWRSPPTPGETATASTLVREGWGSAPPPSGRPVATRTDAAELALSLLEQGRAALNDGDMKSGFEAYRRAVDYYPSADTHGALGGLYLRAAATSSAIFHLRRAADLDTNNADRWLLLANAYFLKPDLGAAWKAIARAQAVEPGITIARDANSFVIRGNAG